MARSTDDETTSFRTTKPSSVVQHGVFLKIQCIRTSQTSDVLNERWINYTKYISRSIDAILTAAVARLSKGDFVGTITFAI